MNTGNILLGDSTQRKTGTITEENYVRSDYRFRLLGENQDTSFTNRANNDTGELFVDLWDDGVYTTPKGRVGLWCINGHGPACEWEPCQTPFMDLYEDFNIEYPGSVSTSDFYSYFDSSVVNTGTPVNPNWECNCQCEVNGANEYYDYLGIEIHDTYAALYEHNDELAYLDVLDYNCTSGCNNGCAALNENIDFLFPNACFAELPALQQEPSDCIKYDQDNNPRLKSGIADGGINCQTGNWAVGFLRDMSEFTAIEYVPQGQGTGVPLTHDTSLVGYDTQGTTTGIFMGIGKVDSPSYGYTKAYWWTSPTDDDGNMVSNSSYKIEKIPESIFDFGYSNIDTGGSITKKSGRFQTENGSAGDWFVDITKCANTTDWDLANWDPLKAMIQSEALGVDDPLLGHNYEEHSSRIDYENACLNPQSSGPNSAMEYSDEVPSAGKIGFIFDSGTYMLNGILADYDILDGRMPAGTEAGIQAAAYHGSGSYGGGMWLGQFGQLEGWYPESWHWAAFGVPLSDTGTPYATDLLNDNYNLDGEEYFCGCYSQGQASEANMNRIFNYDNPSISPEIECTYITMTGDNAGAVVQSFMPIQAIGGGGHWTNAHCYSSEFVSSFLQGWGEIGGEGGYRETWTDVSDGTVKWLQFLDNDEIKYDDDGTEIPPHITFSRPEVPVQIKNEDTEGPTSSNTLKFSNFPNIRKYAIKMIGDFGKESWDWDREHSNQLLTSYSGAGDDGSYMYGDNSLWKGQLKQIFTGQAFCDYYDGINNTKTCGINKWDGSYGKTSIGMGEAASSTFDRIGGPPITEPFSYSKVMDYLLYVSNNGEYTSLFRKDTEGNLSANASVPQAGKRINNNYKFYPGCPGPASYNSDEWVDLFGQGFYDLISDEFGEYIEYMGIQGIKSFDGYHLTDNDMLGASGGGGNWGTNTFIDGDKAHWCGPTLAGGTGGDGSWFSDNLVNNDYVNNSQVGTFYNHHAGWGGFQSGTSCIDWAYTMQIMSYPAQNYYGKSSDNLGQWTNNGTDETFYMTDYNTQEHEVANRVDWNGGRVSARMGEIESPMPAGMDGGNSDINVYDYERIKNLIPYHSGTHWLTMKIYEDDACPQWGCTSFEGESFYNSGSWCGDYHGGIFGNGYGRSRCYCTSNETGEEVYNSDVGDCSVAWTDDQTLANSKCDNHCQSLTDSSPSCDTGECTDLFEQLYSYCIMRNTTFSSPIPDKCHGMVRPMPRPWDPYLDELDRRAAYLIEDGVAKVADGWRNLTTTTWDVVPLPFGWWGGYKQGFTFREGEVSGQGASPYIMGHLNPDDGLFTPSHNPYGDVHHGVTHAGAHPESIVMRADNLTAGWDDPCARTTEDGHPDCSTLVSTFTDVATEHWNPIGLGNNLETPKLDPLLEQDYIGGVPESCNDFCSHHYCQSCGYPKGYGTVYLDGSDMNSYDNQIANSNHSVGYDPETGEGLLQADARMRKDNWHGKQTSRLEGGIGISRGLFYNLGYWNDDQTGEGSETIGNTSPFCLCKCDKTVSETPIEGAPSDANSADMSIGGNVSYGESKHDWSNSTFWKQFQSQKLPACIIDYDTLSAAQIAGLENQDSFAGGAYTNLYEHETKRAWQPWYMLGEGTGQCVPIGDNENYTAANCLKGGGILHTGCHIDGPDDEIIPPLEGGIGRTAPSGFREDVYVNVPDMNNELINPKDSCSPDGMSDGPAGWCCGADYKYLKYDNSEPLGQDIEGRPNFESIKYAYMGHEVFVNYDSNYSTYGQSQEPSSGEINSANCGSLCYGYVNSFADVCETGSGVQGSNAPNGVWCDCYSTGASACPDFNQDLCCGSGNSYMDDILETEGTVNTLPISSGAGNMWHQENSDSQSGSTIFNEYSYMVIDAYGHMAADGRPYALRGNGPSEPVGSYGPNEWPYVRKPYMDLAKVCEDLGGEVGAIDIPLQKVTVAWAADYYWGGDSTGNYNCGDFCGTSLFMGQDPIQKWDAAKTIYKHGAFLDMFRNGLISNLVFGDAFDLYVGYEDVQFFDGCGSNNPEWTTNENWCVSGISSPCEIFCSPEITNENYIKTEHLNWFNNHYMELYNMQVSWTDAFMGGLATGYHTDNWADGNGYGSNWDDSSDAINNLLGIFDNIAAAPFFLNGDYRECGYPTGFKVPAFSFPSVDGSNWYPEEDYFDDVTDDNIIDDSGDEWFTNDRENFSCCQGSHQFGVGLVPQWNSNWPEIIGSMPGCECVGQPGNTMFCQDDVGSDVGYIDTYADITPDKPYCQNRPFGISNSAGTGKGPWFVLRAENEFSQGEYYENCRASDLNGSGIYDTYDDRICGGDNPSNWISDLLDIPTYGQYLFSDEQKCIAAGEWLEANYIFSYTFYGCEMIINQFGETEELSTDDMYSSLFGGTREFATGGPVGKNPREDLIRDPGGHCCDEGPGSYGPAICDPGGTNTIVGLGTGNCHMDSYIPEGAYEQHVGQYCSSPGSVSGPCVCNVDCGTWAWCTINLGSTSNWSQNQTCADLLNMDWAPDCPDEFEENENGDCVYVGTINCPSGLILDEDGVCVDPGDPDFTCNCCPELEGSGTYHCQLNSDGHVVLIDDCNYEFGAMLPIPHVFANAEGYYDDQGVERGLCGLTWGNEDIMEEFGIDNIDDINDHGDGKGQGVTLGTFACGCDCLFHTAEGYSYNAANAFWPFTNGEGTSCDGSIDIAEYYGGSVNVSWMGPVLLDDGSSSQENAWETWSSMPSNPNEAYDIISDLAEEDFATMECNEPNLQNSANQGYYKYTPYSLNWCEVGGCINPLASNYNPRATEQTTTCTCPDGSNYNDNYISGCLDSAAGGYNPNARCDCAGNNCIEGNVCVDNYTGMCTDFPWLCDTSCCTYVQNNAECGAQCQGMYELALYNNYNSVAHRYIDWDYIYRKISEPGTVWFNSDINECMQSYSCALYGSNRLFSSYNEMILAGYNAYGCPDGESCVWGSKLISGQIVTGQICKWTGENSYEGSSGGSTGGTSLGGTRNFTPEEGGIGLIDGPQSPVGTHQENIS